MVEDPFMGIVKHVVNMSKNVKASKYMHKLSRLIFPKPGSRLATEPLSAQQELHSDPTRNLHPSTTVQ